jgi:hypothetical protein
MIGGRRVRQDESQQVRDELMTLLLIGHHRQPPDLDVLPTLRHPANRAHWSPRTTSCSPGAYPGVDVDPSRADHLRDRRGHRLYPPGRILERQAVLSDALDGIPSHPAACWSPRRTWSAANHARSSPPAHRHAYLPFSAPTTPMRRLRLRHPLRHPAPGHPHPTRPPPLSRGTHPPRPPTVTFRPHRRRFHHDPPQVTLPKAFAKPYPYCGCMSTDRPAIDVVDDPNDSELEPIELTPQEEEDLNDAESRPTPVIYSGQDFDVDGLVRRLNKEDILIPTFGHSDERISSAGFQRSFVWSRPQMDRFIESLLLGYPIPGIFLVRQADSRYLVLDGQQRLRTLQHFYNGIYAGREFSLQNVGEQFKGVTYRGLREEQRRVLDNAFFQATIVDTDGSSESLEVIYQIFERLNSGGTQLTPHEIRVALYPGSFIDYLEGLNQDESWRLLYGRKSPRVRDQELILRILAFFESAETYSRPLKTFLNRFAAANRKLANLDTDRLTRLFSVTAGLLVLGPGRSALRPRSQQVNAALTEAIFVGLMKRLAADIDSLPDVKKLTDAVSQLIQSEEILGSTVRSTADEESVRTRLRLATEAMAKV